jgi:hypothetical protein
MMNTQTSTAALLSTLERETAIEPAKPTFEVALAAFVAIVQALVNETYAQNSAQPIVTAEFGQKNVRIVKTWNQRTVHSFVRIEDGAILMSASFKKPAKHVRGSIYAPDNGRSAVDAYGAKYLR